MSSVVFVEKKIRADKLGMLYLSRIMKDAGHAVDMIQDDIDDADLYLSSHHVDFVMYSVVTGEHPWFIKRNFLKRPALTYRMQRRSIGSASGGFSWRDTKFP